MFAQLQAYYQRRLDHALTHDPGTGLLGRLALWRAIDGELFQRKAKHAPNGIVVIASCCVAVNISSHNLSDEDFPFRVQSQLKQHNLSPSALELEVTQSDIMRNPEIALEALNQLADIPLVISIDDFGTGYSSLAYLHRLPATIVKIDRQLSAGLTGISG